MDELNDQELDILLQHAMDELTEQEIDILLQYAHLKGYDFLNPMCKCVLVPVDSNNQELQELDAKYKDYLDSLLTEGL